MLDLRIVNANVITMAEGRPRAREVGLWRGRIVGVDEEIAGLPARDTVDLRGATVLPGFVDAHVHLAWAGLRAGGVSIAPSERVDDVLATIGSAVTERPFGEWVDVLGYDQRSLGRHLTAAELDTVSAGRKVFVVHDSGHACVVNSDVLAMLPAGTTHQDGVLTERGMAAVRRLRQPYAVEELIDAIGSAARTCVSEGVTTCAEAGIGGGLISHSPIELTVYQTALERGVLPVRVQLMIAADQLRDAAAHPSDGVPRALDLGLRTGFGGDRLTIGALKVFTDGGMMPRTAALTEPYVDPAGAPDNTGELFADLREIEHVVVDAHRAGWQLAVHAIGDRAVDVALDALDAAITAQPRPHRHRIEHAGLVRPDQLPRFAELGVTAVVQPNFLWYLGDDYASIMGPRRAPWLYRGRGFLDHGVRLVGSSDRPVTVGAPLRSIQFMVERRTESGLSLGPDESVTVADALRAFTIEGAHACHLEDSLGSIESGKHADFVVLSADPTTVDVSAIGDLDVRTTVVAGEIVHGEW
ncbi:hypothetical protein EV193_102108 [Herbihabitans rhizosphaerae]|uniref:Amidohydrolase 3 domain-containing protein n=1 Tax=Herbihabitans rhizosphaerae TaxID=1872711 RepID=A0A4Q7L4J9_9PSEU|nr:amidohydrolase [Herbihabitans rhizosphaerae]RZS43132.1 hypothetical protein EV193_102108 [Herbihabitans rhizosphaerae]